MRVRPVIASVVPVGSTRGNPLMQRDCHACLLRNQSRNDGTYYEDEIL